METRSSASLQSGLGTHRETSKGEKKLYKIRASEAALLQFYVVANFN
jgi:hypothetical protein